MEDPKLNSRQSRFRSHREKDPLDIYRRPLPLFGAAVVTLGGLAMVVIGFMNSDANVHKLILFGTVMLVAFIFGFGALIVRSYNRDKKKLMEQHPYRHDHTRQ